MRRIGVRRVTAHLLIATTERVALNAVADVGAEGLFVDFTQQCPALLASIEPAPLGEVIPRPQVVCR